MRCQARIYGAEFSAAEIEQVAGKGGLLSMEIEFNRDCNFKCVYCYVQNGVNGKQEMTAGESRGVIQQAKDLGARKIIILGGEPMLYPHIMEMIGFIKGLDLDIELFTNGANMTQDSARILAENNVTVVLKMNTTDEKLQDILSGKKGAYRQIQAAFNILKEEGFPHNSPLGISTVICRQNIGELVRMWEWLREQNISPYFEMITPQGRARENDFLSADPRQVWELFQRIADIDRNKFGYDWKPQPPLVGEQCLRHQFSCAVNVYGDVTPCVGVTIPVGNVKEKKLSEIILDSEVIQDLRNYKNTIKGPCGKCAKKSVCYGCRGAAYQMTGDYLASDPLCWENLDRQEDIICLPTEAAKLVPHKPPMLMVNKLMEVKERASLSEAEIPADAIFAGEDGRLDEASYPEIISQAIAAQDGLKHAGNGGPKSQGLLLGIKNLEILGSAHAGDKLLVSVSKVARFSEFGIIKGEIFKGEDLIARGEITVWHNGDK
ncbi:MAG: radical SAM protein [Nitrospirae bacterium]|nr:radical SAM protein [Nitrospirota bacterium]